MRSVPPTMGPAGIVARGGVPFQSAHSPVEKAKA